MGGHANLLVLGEIEWVAGKGMGWDGMIMPYFSDIS